MKRKVEVVPYDSAWRELYEREAELLKKIFEGEIIACHHIGSTSVPGLAAKPVIDILAEVKDIQKVDLRNMQMASLGYIAKGENGIEGRRYFIKGTETLRSHHIHIYEAGHPQLAIHLNFRDYLIAHPDEARAYGELKQKLAAQYPEDIDKYIEGKDAFAQELSRKAMDWKMNAYPTVFSITEDEMDLNGLLDKITLASTGAAAIFTGMVRGVTARGDFHNTEYLEYEAYVPMAEAKMKQVADEIRERWNSIEGIAIVQRIGRLYPRTPTVLIACTAAHRDTGVFDAARYGIDRLKEIVPVWKKEVGPNGEEWVEGDYIPKAGE